MKLLLAIFISVFCSLASATDYKYNLLWENGASLIRGEITFNTLIIPGTQEGTQSTFPTTVSDGKITLGGTTYTKTSTNPITGGYILPVIGFTLDPINTSNIIGLC